MKYYYIRINYINGVRDYVKLGEWLNSSGTGVVDYDKGGWSDQMMSNISPHLRFENEADAVAYILSHGGVCLTEIPSEDMPPWGG